MYYGRRIILKWILERYDGVVWIASQGLSSMKLKESKGKFLPVFN
jgi:hypothetical protein